MAAEVTEKQILDELKKVPFPGYTRDIVSFGLVKKVTSCGGVVKVEIGLVSSTPSVPQQIERDVKGVLAKIPGVTQANVEMHVTPARQTPAGGMPGSRHPETGLLPGVRTTIAVASGKGGVGKSTVAVNLALALARCGSRVGVLDGDIYGPNVPIMLGLQTQLATDGKQIVPAEKYGIQVVSMGFLAQEDAAVIWRGPMLHGVIQQFFRDVAWKDLDYLIIDRSEEHTSELQSQR